MPMAPISMRKLKEILRLKYGCSLSHRKIAKVCLFQRQLCLFIPFVRLLLEEASWPLDEQWSDDSLQRAFSKLSLRVRATYSLNGLRFSKS
jgi:hypothetical protein